jgi:hypothetical protein
MYVSLILWLGGGVVVMALVWLATRAFERSKVPFRIAALVLIFTPTIYLGHPVMIQPVWITLFWDKANIVTASVYWLVAAVLVTLIQRLASKRGKE